MTQKEALKEIINTPPKGGIWYKVSEDEQLQTYLRVTALRVFNGTAKIDTMKKFFNIMGYDFDVIVTKRNV